LVRLLGGLNPRGEGDSATVRYIIAFWSPYMRAILRAIGIIYVAQAAAGFAIGFTLPWLRFFEII
jgi:hypothetical protein